METEPLLTSPSRTHLEDEDEEITRPQFPTRQSTFEITPESPQSPTHQSTFEITPESLQSLTHQSEENEDQFPDPISNSRKKNNLRRRKTTPTMAIIGDLNPHMPKPQLKSNPKIGQALILIFIYFLISIIVYMFYRKSFSGNRTFAFVDAFYFSIVTISTIGYGDIVPTTPVTKVFCCLFVLVGFGFISSLLSRVVNYMWDLQENMILNREKWDGDVKEGRMGNPMKVGLALGVVILCIVPMSLVLYFVEKLDWVDSIYLSIMSVTTVGYGDRAFKTLLGRLFASVWLFLSTLAMARAFLYLAEVRTEQRHRRITYWILNRDMIVEDLFAADVNNNGFISKSDYVIYKLKEMGKIGEDDILLICNEFEKLDPNNSGKITITDLLGNLDDRKEGRHGQASL